MVCCIAYDCSNKDADKKGISFFRLPRDHKLRLTWFKKLRLVDPPNTDNVRVCSEHFTEECFIVDMQAAMGFRKSKRRLTKDAVPTLFSFSKLAVPRVLSERRAKRAEKKQLLTELESVAIIPAATSCPVETDTQSFSTSSTDIDPHYMDITPVPISQAEKVTQCPEHVLPVVVHRDVGIQWEDPTTSDHDYIRQALQLPIRDIGKNPTRH